MEFIAGCRQFPRASVLLPLESALPVPEPAHTCQTAVILTALDVETRAVLRHLSHVSTETVSGFDQ
jgi:hypothetical protein